MSSSLLTEKSSFDDKSLEDAKYQCFSLRDRQSKRGLTNYSLGYLDLLSWQSWHSCTLTCSHSFAVLAVSHQRRQGPEYLSYYLLLPSICSHVLCLNYIPQPPLTLCLLNHSGISFPFLKHRILLQCCHLLIPNWICEVF